MRVKHLVISRVAIRWRYKETGLLWGDWLENSFYLFNAYCRPSLKNQTNQDFTLLSFVDESVTEFGNVLDNEEIVFVKSSDNVGKILSDYINVYVDKIKNDYEYVILTRIDRDDCLKNDFIEIVKKHLIIEPIINKYIDLYHLFIYDSINKKMYDSNQYNDMISPFVSTIEKIENGKIPCTSLMTLHPKIGEKLNGEKLENLLAVQVIHEYNLMNGINGNVVEYDIRNFNK